MIPTSSIVLTNEQQSALEAFFTFLADPKEVAFVLAGYSGTGKSTLVKTIIDQMPVRQKVMELLDPTYKGLDAVFTATTNKAAENLAFITGQSVVTIHSFLGLRVSRNYETGITELKPSYKKSMPEHHLVFVDEASSMDSALLEHTFALTRNCKIVFIGDPAQLLGVKASTAPVFNAGFPTAVLTQVVRQAEGNPIIDLATKFRHTVNTGEFFSFKPDGIVIKHVQRQEFETRLVEEFDRPDWNFRDSKVMGYTNACVTKYNQAINNLLKGTPHLRVGDYAICNSFVKIDKHSIKTDQTVLITRIDPEFAPNFVPGNNVTLDYLITAFLPKSRQDKQNRLKQAKAEKNYQLVEIIESEWIDLRPAFASTIDKAQGSTYDKVFIDLDDIRSCNSGDRIARMMYVGVSRARHQVILTGDLA